MRVRETGLIVAREVRESLRSRWFLCAAGSFLVLSLSLSMLGLAGADRTGLAGYDRTTASILNLALLFVPLLTIVLGALGIAGEGEDGSLGALLAQPVTRAEVYAGKYLGMLASVWAAILAGMGATGVLIGLRAEGGDPRAFGLLVLLMLLLAAATLSIGTLLSSAASGRARVVGAAFGVWLVLAYLADLGTIALTLARQLPAERVFLLALCNPVQQARLLGIMALSDRLDLPGPAGLYALDRFGREGAAGLLVACLAATAVLPLALGYGAFRKAALS